MHSKLNVTQWVVASVAVFVVLSILEFLVGRFMLGPWAVRLFPTEPQPEDMMTMRVWVYLGRAIFSLIFVFVFTRGYEGKPGVGEGLRYGLWIGLLIYLPQFFMNIVLTHRPADFLAVRGLASLVEAVVSGLIVGMIYKGPQKAAT
jgi:hypothetical protein